MAHLRVCCNGVGLQETGVHETDVHELNPCQPFHPWQVFAAITGNDTTNAMYRTLLTELGGKFAVGLEATGTANLAGQMYRTIVVSNGGSVRQLATVIANQDGSLAVLVENK